MEIEKMLEILKQIRQQIEELKRIDEQRPIIALAFLINKFGSNWKMEFPEKEMDYFFKEIMPDSLRFRSGVRDGKFYIEIVPDESKKEIHKCNHCTEH
jgi:hypothetical protein